MITEDYVSFEIAKLLKENGFDVCCIAVYSLQGQFKNPASVFSLKNNEFIYAPTLQMAIKWLREVHNIHIEIAYNMGYFPICISTRTNDTIPYIAMGKPFAYEKACEVAIKYCLENLI